MVQATKAAAMSRRIIESDWYAARWPDVLMRPDQNAKSRYENTLGGARYSFSTGGVVTGDHATVLLWDDPLKAADALSPVKRERAIEFLTDTLPSRFADPMNATMIIMGQRLHEKDPSGHLLAEQVEQRDPSFVPVILPAHFDPDRACKTRWFRDPRKERGELLWPERFPEKALAARTRHMTPRAISAQYEQDPTAGAGGIIKAKDWRIWPQKLPQFDQIMITLDPALKDNDDGSFWACGVWGMFTPAHAWDVSQGPAPDNLPDTQAIMLIEAWRQRSGYFDAKTKLRKTIDEWTIEGEPPGYVVIEETVAGALLVEEFTRAGVHGICPYLPTKSKRERAEIASSLWHFGLVWVPGKKLGDGRRSDTAVTEWAKPVLDECQAFPHGETDDFLDVSSMAALFARQCGQITLEDDWRDILEGKGRRQRKRRVAAYG
jgi:phage terminase large subunit-like protein